MATKNVEQVSLMSDDAFRVEDDDTPAGRDVLKTRLKNEKEFFRVLDNLPEVYKVKFDPEQVKKTYENANSITILVTGKTGSGKSTLVNGVLGVTLPQQMKAKEGNSISEACTKEVTAYHDMKEDVAMTIWDTPGLQDSTDNERYLQQMREKCGERDFTMYCIDVRQTRFLSGGDISNPDIVAMKKLTREFGPQFWNNTVIVLTFFNCIEDDIHIKYLETAEEKKKAVEAKLQEWKVQIFKLLVDDVKISQQAAENVIIVPAGHYREQHLPVRKYWLSNLWLRCFTAISSQEGQLALLKVNFSRLKNEADVKADDFKKDIEHQPIVNEARSLNDWFRMLWEKIKNFYSKKKKN